MSTRALVLSASLLAACTSSDRVCDPGATQACICPSEEGGAQSCADDGTRWEACRCEGPAAAAAPQPAEVPEPAPTQLAVAEADAPTPAPPHRVVPRPLFDMVDDFRPSDVGSRFVWVATSDSGPSRAQLHCDEHAIEAARRAVARFSHRALHCTRTGCNNGEEAGNSDPFLFGSPGGGGNSAVLIGYWNGMAGDADYSRVERWLNELECGQIVDASP